MKLSIVHVTPFYIPVVGGLEISIHNLASRQARDGHEVYVITTNRTHSNEIPDIPFLEQQDKVTIIRLGTYISYSYGSIMRGLTGLVKNINPDIIHMHVYRHPHTLMIKLLRRFAKDAKIILNVHDPFPEIRDIGVLTYSYYKIFDRCLGKIISKNYDAIVCTSSYGCEIIKKIIGYKNNVVKIPLPIAEYFYNSEKLKNSQYNAQGFPITLLYVGRIVKQKNIKLLISLFRLLKKRLKNIKLLIISPNYLSDTTQPELKNLKQTHLAQFWENIHGLPNKELKKYYESSFVTLNLSSFEAFGMSIAESIACGTPAITTARGGPRDILTNQLTFLVCNNVAEVARKILFMVKNLDFYYNLAKICSTRAITFHPSFISSLYYKLYLKI